MGIKSRTVLAALGIVASASAVVSTSSLPSSQTACVDSSETYDAVESLMNVYCRGPLLDAVQHAELFNDSKYFVDMPIKSNSSAVQILAEFERDVLPSLPSLTNATLEPILRAFVTRHFDEPGSELRKIVLSDFSETVVPPRIASIKNEVYRTWAMGLHSLWKELGRSPSRDVISSYLHPTPLASLGDSDASTVIVVPGGRFRESYYWDSYWIIEGLLVSSMKDTARRVVRNLLEYVGQYGFVPNGGRIYYLTRSQPPMLSDMVRLVATKGNASTQQAKVEWDIEYLRAVVPLLEKEYTFWMTSHAVEVTKNGATYKLNHYTADANAPRPESYREDVRLAETAFPKNQDRQNEFYDDIIAAAESGWDFSSRWFRDHETLATIVTRDVVPVDLNVIMHRVESNLATFYEALGDISAAKRFRDAVVTRSRAIDAVFWDEKSSSWRDYYLSSGSLSPVVAVSNYSPLWGRAFANDDRDRLNRVVSSLRTSGLIQVAGVQTTTKLTGEQWDAPNAWPPLQDIVIEGLLSVKTKEADDLATELVRTWVQTSLAAWNSTGLMFEKYNTTVVGGLGTGGEYTPQFGFGWTNGVILKFLTSFQEILP